MRFYIPKRRQPNIIIVSLIDILTILLIFFVVTTTFRLPQPQVTINLPESAATGAAPSPEQPLIVHVTADEQVFLGDAPVAISDLPARIRQAQDAGRQVAMKADRKAPFGTIITIMDGLRAAGVRALPAFTQSDDNR